MEQIENQDVSEGELSLTWKRRIKRKRNISIKLSNLSLVDKNNSYRAEATQQQMTTNVQATGAETIHGSNEGDYMNKSIFKQEPENVAILSEKNVKKVKDVRKKLEQNKDEEQMEKKNKKKLKNIEVTHQQTKNVKAVGGWMIDDTSEEDDMHKSIFEQESENFATLSEKNVKKIKDVRKKLKQNKNKEEMKNKNKKKLKNIEITHQQMTKNVKTVDGWMISDSSEEDYMHRSIFTQKSENLVTLSKKNVKEIKYVRKKLKQNKNEEQMEKKSKKKLKNIEVTQHQMTTDIKATGAETIHGSNEGDYMNKSIFKQEPENVAILSEKNVKKVKDVRKKLEQNKDEEQMEKKNKKKLKNIEVTHQQTKNVKAVGGWMIDDTSEEDDMHKSIFEQESENFATLSEKNVKKIKDVRKKLKQNKNKEEMKNKNKKKLKNIEITHQQMTKNVKTVDGWMISDSSEEDYMHRSIFTQKSENLVTLSKKNVKEIKYVRKKLKQNKNEEQMEKKSKKKLKNIEVTQHQMTTDIKAAGAEMIHDSNEEDYMLKSIFKQESENIATLSEKNVKKIKDVRKKLEQNRNEETDEKIDKNKLKNIEETQQQMTTVEVSHNDIITELNRSNCIRVPVYIRQSENFATLSEKNIKKIKHVRKKLKQNINKEKDEKIDENKLKNIEETQQQVTVEVSHNDIITEPNKADCIRVPVYIRQSENFATLSEKNVKEIKYVPEKFEQSPEQVDKNSLTKLLIDSEEKMNKIINNEIKAMKLLEDIKTNVESIIIRRQIRSKDKITDAKTENDVNNSCQTSVNNKSKEHGYTLNETVEEDQVMKIVEENEIKEVENTDPGTISNETLLYGKDAILENNGKMTNRTLMVEDTSNVAHKIDKQIDVRKNWWTYIENMFSSLLLSSLLLLYYYYYSAIANKDRLHLDSTNDILF